MQGGDNASARAAGFDAASIDADHRRTHDFATTCRVRSSRTGTPLRPDRSCVYRPTEYAHRHHDH
jgi:hypothetical protein